MNKSILCTTAFLLLLMASFSVRPALSQNHEPAKHTAAQKIVEETNSREIRPIIKPANALGKNATPGQYHVTATQLNVRTKASRTAKIVGKLKKFDTVTVLENVGTEWTRIRYKVAGKNQDTAFVAAEFLRAGAGKKAKYARCKKSLLKVKGDGRLLKKRTRGNNVLMVNNMHQDLVMVRLRTATAKRRLVLEFLVAKQKTYVISGIGNGTYKLSYILGRKFSRGCNQFLSLVSSPREVNKPISMRAPRGKYVESMIHLYKEVGISAAGNRVLTNQEW